MRSTKFHLFILTGGLVFHACSSPEPTLPGGTGGAATGGTSSGGALATTGGQAPATGGSVATTGGAASTGGTTTTGGSGMGGATGGTKSTGGTSTMGGGSATGGASATGGSATGGSGGASKGSTGGAKSTGGNGGASATGGSSTGGTGGAGTGTRTDGPCDIYAAGSTPCVAAYSMIRALSKAYTGPLYQVRSGSSAANTGTGGMLKDIGMTADGFADAASQDAFCTGTVCTVAKLYDQSGNGNHIGVAKKGLSNGGATAAMDDFESSATKGKLKVGGRDVYSLYMAAREGYRLPAVGKGMPRGTAAQGIYMLADGTHYGTACCWDFGNVTTDPTKYGVMNTLFFGVAFWGNGAGAGPWFMADFEAGVWAGGSKSGDPGWGALDGAHPANPNNPSMKVPYAFGILKTTPSNYTLRSGNGQSGTLTTSFDGALPKAMDNLGGIVLGVGGDNSNNSWGTFFEGAITAGAPSATTDAAVLTNVQAAKYGQ